MKKTTPTGKSRNMKSPAAPMFKKVAKTGRNLQSISKKLTSKKK